MTLTFFVAGIPQPQGSARGFVVKGRAVVTSDNPKNKDWRTLVHDAMEKRVGRLSPGPFYVRLEFVLPRTKSLGTKTKPHTTRPDVDKLVRSALDAGHGVIWADDSRVTDITARKRYAKVAEQTGVHISIIGVEPEALRLRSADNMEAKDE